MVKRQKRIVATENDVENENYAFRCFLLRLGFIGDEYKAARKILLRNLTGSAAWKGGAPNAEEREILERLRREYPVGCRVELLQMDDVTVPPVGTKGTVTGIDDTGSIMVDWDNGSGLNCLYVIDRVRKVVDFDD